jgi:hypothetical protein
LVDYGSWLRENSEIEFTNGNFVSTSINLKNKSAGDGCQDKTIEKTILRAFRARTFSRSQGQSRHFGRWPTTSGLSPGADIVTAGRHVSKVPQADIANLI